MSPQDTRVVAGDPARLDCSPPKGHPPPSLSWVKDGHILQSDSRYVNPNVTVMNLVTRWKRRVLHAELSRSAIDMNIIHAYKKKYVLYGKSRLTC